MRYTITISTSIASRGHSRNNLANAFWIAMDGLNSGAGLATLADTNAVINCSGGALRETAPGNRRSTDRCRGFAVEPAETHGRGYKRRAER